ncbi:MaoC family dehydratase [Alloalcanivorax xenomutans]|nr:MaoC family dehydratase [Alloalcanivorax xenomutans]MCE7522041.1 MaoC family dehydratase [Alloalcanivorax xenomutans]
MSDVKRLLEGAKFRAKGNGLDDMEVGQVFKHHWGRTVLESDCVQFSTMTLNFNPLYFNKEYAKAHGHSTIVVNPMMVFLTVFGLSVEDLSESGGAFLGVENLNFLKAVYPDDTLTARSEVIDLRDSDSRPGMGIATWHTEGFNQRNEKVIDFDRTNLIAKKLNRK